MPELLKTIEGIPELIVSVEVMTLEDSYVKAVKSAQPAEIEHIHKKKHLRIYNATQGKLSTWRQIWSMISKRLRMFSRDPSQWFLATTPVISVGTVLMLMYALFEYTQIAQLQDLQRQHFNFICVSLTSFILVCGYSTSTPLYSEIAVDERITWKRHMQKLSGMRTNAYCIGLLLADLTIWLIPTCLMVLCTCFVGETPFNDQLASFILCMLFVGAPVISMSYALGFFFESASQASRWNIIIQLLILTLVPLVLVYIFAGLATPIFDLVILVFYLVSPMFTLYMTNFVTASNFFNPVMVTNQVKVPNIWGA